MSSEQRWVRAEDLPVGPTYVSLRDGGNEVRVEVADDDSWTVSPDFTEWLDARYVRRSEEPQATDSARSEAGAWLLRIREAVRDLLLPHESVVGCVERLAREHVTAEDASLAKASAVRDIEIARPTPTDTRGTVAASAIGFFLFHITEAKQERR